MISLSMPETRELKPRIIVFGVGGAGGNAVNNMIANGLVGVDFVVANTDAQALTLSLSQRRIQLGAGLTQGLGAGSRPEVGRDAAEEVLDDLREQLGGSHMIFITAGMGGGTGTGAAPVIAKLAREMGVLTVGVVTKPFQFEGNHRMKIAEAGIQELSQYVDTLIIIPNQNLFRVANEKTTFADAFKMADNVLQMGVRGITDLMVVPGLINLDFNDVKTVMSEMGKAMMGTGEAEGERRAIEAAERAINNPLLDDISMKGARGVLINITGGPDLTLFEVDEAANRIRSEVDPDANIIVGSALDETLSGRMRVSVVATGIDAMASQQPMGMPSKPVTAFARPAERPAPVAAPVAAVATSFIPPVPVTPELEIAPSIAASQSNDEPVDLTEESTAIETTTISETESADLLNPVMLEKKEPFLAAQPSFALPQDGQPSVAAGFIPPRAETPTLSAEPTRLPDPYREADMVNAARVEVHAPRKPSLFERMMGIGRAAEPRGPMRQEPALGPQLRGNPSSAPQPQLSLGATAADTNPKAQADEDLLEIPAFLRRQAN